MILISFSKEEKNKIDGSSIWEKLTKTPDEVKIDTKEYWIIIDKKKIINKRSDSISREFW